MKLRAVFMGSPAFAVPCLEVAHRRLDVRLVLCQPDRPAGRGHKVASPAVKVAALALDLPVYQPTKLRDGEAAARLRGLELDVAIVVAYGRILPRELLEIPRHGCINVHASVLPRWRGAAPIQRAVLAGDETSGVTIMQMDEGLDTGPVFRTGSVPIAPGETSGELTERLSVRGAALLDAFLASFPAVPSPQPQDEALVTLAPPLRKEEGVVDWSRDARTVAAHVCGMDPWPGAATRRGEGELKLFRAYVAPAAIEPEQAARAAGEVLRVDVEGLHVQTGLGVVIVREVQPAGRKRMPAAAYAAGRPFSIGERLG